MNSLKVDPVDKKRKKILVVDDEDLLRELLSEFLGDSGFETFTASNGAEGLSISQKEGDLALIICDIQMPLMDGFAFVGELKKLGMDIPIIFISAFNDPGIVDKAKKIGVQDFVIKPYREDFVLELINNITSPKK